MLPNGCEALLNGVSISVAREVAVYDSEVVVSRLERLLEKGDLSTNPNYAQIQKIYERMLFYGGNRYIVSPPAVEALNVLLEHAPNFHEVIEDFKNDAAIYAKSSRPLAITPVLLLGDPGVGKTHFARKFAQILGTGFHVIPFSSQTAGWILSGADPLWRGAKEGKVAEHLIDGHFANPVYVLDEIDKARNNNQTDPLGPLYTLLEEDSAQNFTDEFIDVKINASHVIYVATANRLEDIPEPIQNRMNVYYIQAPTRDQVRTIAQVVYKNIVAPLQIPGFSPQLSDDVLNLLANQPPRTLKRIIKKALGYAVRNNRDQISTEDIDTKASTNQKNPIGFVQ